MGPAYGGCPGWGGDRSGRMAPGPLGTARQAEEIDSRTAVELAQASLAHYGNALEIAEVMEFSNNFYLQARERDSGHFVMELLVTRDGQVMPEPGPNMMWNRKYGHMDRAGLGSIYAKMPIAPAEALAIAQEYLDRACPGAAADQEADAFYGYYTIHVLVDGRIVGMLSVNGYTGQVWYHSWHGEFLGMEGDHEG